VKLRLALGFLAMLGAASAQQEVARFRKAFERVDGFTRLLMKDAGTPGAAVAITSRQGVLWVGTYGYANKDSHDAVTTATRFGVGSIGKSFTAVATLILSDKGRLDPHAPIAQYLPWLAVKSTIPITTHHLLTHTAGLPDMRMDLMSPRYQALWLTQLPTPIQPEKQYHYSSSGFDVMSVLVEELWGKQFGEAVREGILAPLEMERSFPVLMTTARPFMAMSYEPLYDDRPSDPRAPLIPSNWYEYGGGAGAQVTTVEDLAAYLRMLMNRGNGPHGRVLSEKAFGLLTQRAVKRPGNRYYGYGVEISEEEGHVLIGHGGGVQGFRSAMLGDMDDGLGVVVLVNSPLRTDLIAQFALRTARAALHEKDIPEAPAIDRPEVVQNPAEYAGKFAAPDGSILTFSASGDRLVLLGQERSTVLERRGPDSFYWRQDPPALFLLRFHRQNDVVTHVSYGSRWYANEKYVATRAAGPPPEWTAYPGHYRTATRHHINFRVVFRQGPLLLVTPGGDESLLTRLPDGRFRVRDTPEWVSFDSIVNGQALRMNYSGTDYHRDFTP
jgi:D-alanyl-D-alanine carboxypeptidase